MFFFLIKRNSLTTYSTVNNLSPLHDQQRSLVLDILFQGHNPKQFVSILALVLATLFSFPVASVAKELIVVGTGDSQSLLRLLGEAFNQTYPEINITIPDSIGSSGGIRAVASGKYTLGRTARPLSDKEMEFGLTEFTFGYSAVAIFINKSITGIENISSEQLVSVFHGTTSNWADLGGPDQKIYLVNRETGDSSQKVLCRQIPGFTAIKKFPGPVFFSTSEAMDALAKNRNTIGYGPLSMILPSKMRSLSFNNVSPSAENISNDTYPLFTPFSLVWKGKLPENYQRFVDYLKTPDAKKIMVSAGVQPAVMK
jgi:phosphate transport system substrate-binding protein